jgi:hypothetical protein
LFLNTDVFPKIRQRQVHHRIDVAASGYRLDRMPTDSLASDLGNSTSRH